MRFSFFFFNDTATTEIYTLSLHDALPIFAEEPFEWLTGMAVYPHDAKLIGPALFVLLDRKSTRLNSSHGYISYAVFCLKKKKKKTEMTYLQHLLSLLNNNEIHRIGLPRWS